MYRPLAYFFSAKEQNGFFIVYTQSKQYNLNTVRLENSQISETISQCQV